MYVLFPQQQAEVKILTARTTTCALTWGALTEQDVRNYWTWHKKLLDVAQELAGCDRSQGGKLTNWEVRLWWIHRYLEGVLWETVQLHIKLGMSPGESVLASRIVQRLLVLEVHISLPWQGWENFELVSEMPTLKLTSIGVENGAGF